jgi:hypothetical protein
MDFLSSDTSRSRAEVDRDFDPGANRRSVDNFVDYRLQNLERALPKAGDALANYEKSLSYNAKLKLPESQILDSARFRAVETRFHLQG